MLLFYPGQLYLLIEISRESLDQFWRGQYTERNASSMTSKILCKVIESEWANIFDNTIHKLYESIPTRLIKVMDRHGRKTRYKSVGPHSWQFPFDLIFCKRKMWYYLLSPLQYRRWVLIYNKYLFVMMYNDCFCMGVPLLLHMINFCDVHTVVEIALWTTHNFWLIC